MPAFKTRYSGAAADFERLFFTGSPQAKSYALVGIRTTNPHRFKDLASSLRSSKESVSTEGGCIISHETIGGVLKRIEARDYLAGKSSR